MEFKIGDRVRVLTSIDRDLIGAVGKVVYVYSDYQVAVDFIDFLEGDHRLHNAGMLETKTGWYMSPNNLELVEELVEDPISKFFDKHPLEN
jgi:hypothetical protein